MIPDLRLSRFYLGKMHEVPARSKVLEKVPGSASVTQCPPTLPPAYLTRSHFNVACLKGGDGCREGD